MKNLIYSVPFILLSLYGNAQITRQQAIEIMINDVVGPDSLNIHHLYSRYEKLYLNDSLIIEADGVPVMGIYDENWVFFVDLLPQAFWAHPCLVVLIDVSNGDYTLYDEMWPPYPYLYNSDEFFTEWEWILSVGLDNQTKNDENNFTIAPNPFNNRIKVNYNNLSGKSLTISIFDNLGQLVMKTNHYYNLNSNGIIEIDTKKLKPGIFFLQITENNNIVSREKMIKR